MLQCAHPAIRHRISLATQSRDARGLGRVNLSVKAETCERAGLAEGLAPLSYRTWTSAAL
jgi:hypothetical protein